MIKNKSISLFVATFLIIGFLFLALPEKGFSGIKGLDMGCCQLMNIGCFNTDGSLESQTICRRFFGEDIVGESCNESTGQCELLVTDVPTLSEWGLIAMAGVLGLVGFMVIRRRKVTV